MAHFPPPSIPQYGPSGQISQFTPVPQHHPAYMPVQPQMMPRMQVPAYAQFSPQQHALAQTHAQRVVPPQYNLANEAEIASISSKSKFLIAFAKFMNWDCLKNMAANQAAQDINVTRAEGGPQVTAQTLKFQLQLQMPIQMPILMMLPAHPQMAVQPQMAAQPKILNDTELQQKFREVMGREPYPSPERGVPGELELVKKRFQSSFQQPLELQKTTEFLKNLKKEDEQGIREYEEETGRRLTPEQYGRHKAFEASREKPWFGE